MGVYSEEFLAKCRRFMEQREKRDAEKEAYEATQKEYKEMEAELWADLAPDDPNDPDAKLTAHKVPLGQPWGTITFQPRETIYARVIDNEAAAAHYKQRGMVEEVTTPKFAMARLNEEVRGLVETNGEFPPGIDYYPTRFISVTRPK